MPNEIAKVQPTMTTILASNGIKELATSLALTNEQITRAKSTALALSGNVNLAKCDPFSLVKFCYETARYNFTRDDCIYPVPYWDKDSGKTKVQAQLGFKGIRELVYRSGNYSVLSASKVYSGDKVVRDRDTGEIKVEFSTDIEAVDGEVIGYYAFAKDNNGKLVASKYMSKAQVEKHRDKYSKAKGMSPWNTEFDQMALKTVTKRLCSDLPTSPLLTAALKQDQIVYGGANEADTYLDNPTNDKPVERKGVQAPNLADLSHEDTEGGKDTQPTDEIAPNVSNRDEYEDDKPF